MSALENRLKLHWKDGSYTNVLILSARVSGLDCQFYPQEFALGNCYVATFDIVDLKYPQPPLVTGYLNPADAAIVEIVLV